MSDIAIRIEHLSKQYHIQSAQRGDDRLGDKLADGLRSLFGRARRPHVSQSSFWALKDISFDVKHGEVIGLIGGNGAGKSTLLKILSRITEPTEGMAEIYGRMSSLLEVGTGFVGDLSGRENVYLSGAIMGMKKSEIDRRFDEIVEFSGVEQFIDTPIKHYSSGMYVRLGFSVAAHLEPEILIVDEVLAVGDAQFQKKCLGKMGDVSRAGRTVLFVSHSMPAVLALCKRVVLLSKGRVAHDGPAADVAAEYFAMQPAPGERDGNVAGLPRSGTGKAQFAALEIFALDGTGARLPQPTTGCDLVFVVEIECKAAVTGVNVAVEIADLSGYRLVDVNTALGGEHISMTAGERTTVTFRLHDVLLRPGQYDVSLWIGRGGLEDVDYVSPARRFEVQPPPAPMAHTEVFPGTYQCRFTHVVKTTDAVAREVTR
jgi:lipopolysaccharide transport system ATP-binding protein